MSLSNITKKIVKKKFGIFVVYLLIFLPTNSLSAPFIIEFQGIRNFDEDLYIDRNFYAEIKNFPFKRVFGEKYGFCIAPYETCPCESKICPRDFRVQPENFTHPARAVLPFSLISETIKRYAKIVRVKLPPEILPEMLPEIYELVKQNPPYELSFDLEIKSVDVRTSYENEFVGTCWEKFKHTLTVEFRLDIDMWLGRTYSLKNVRFKAPATLNIGAWTPDIISPPGEIDMKRGTIYLTFGTCYTELFPEFSIQTQALFNFTNYKDFEERLGKLISFVLYKYLGEIDFTPVVFPILHFFIVDIKKTYPGVLTLYHPSLGEITEQSIILEFDSKPAGGSPNPPEFSVVSVPYRFLPSYFVEIEVKAPEDTMFITYRLDNGAWSGWIDELQQSGNQKIFPIRVSNLPQGRHVIDIIAQSIFGTINEEAKRVEFFVDRTPPIYEVYIPKFSNKLYLRIKAEDNSGEKIISVVKVKDSAGNTIFEKTDKFKEEIEFEEDGLPEGNYRVFVALSDLAGNWTEENLFDILIDKTPPMIRPIYVPEKYTRYDRAKIVVEFEDNFFSEGEVEYFIEEVVSERRISCFSEWGRIGRTNVRKPIGEVDISGLENEKKYHICFRAKDPAGNFGETFESFFTVDISPPEIQIVSFPPRVTIETSVKILATAKDNMTMPDKLKFFWSFKNTEKVFPFKFGNSLLLSLRDLEDGRYKVSIYAMDEAGNTSKYEELEFIVDTSLRVLGGGEGIKVGCSAYHSYVFIYYFLVFIFVLLRKMKIRIPPPMRRENRGTKE